MNVNINLSRRVLKKIIKYLILFLLGCITIFYVNTLNVKAATIGSDLIFGCNLSGTPTNGVYTFSSSETENGNGYLGSTYPGTMSVLEFGFNSLIEQGNTYTLDLYANTGDWRNISTSTIQSFGSIGSKTCTNNINNYTITSVVSTYYKITITFISNSTANYSKLLMYNEGYTPITGISNWKIDSIVLTDLGNSNTSEIIDNQNQATQDIIDSQNSTKNEIIDNQNKNNEELKDTIQDGLQDCYQKNLLDKSKYSIIGNVVGLDLSLLEKGKTYTFSSNQPIEELKISETRSGATYPGLYYWVQGTGFTKFTFTMPSDKDTSSLYLFLYLPPNDTIVSNISQLDGYNLQIEEGSSATSYVEPGEVCTNKIDETNDKLNDINSNLTDSSDPNLAIGDVAGWLPPGPVDSVLNLPLTILNSLISNLSNRTCSAVDVPLPYIDKSIQLPCLSTVFEKTGFTDVLNTISIPFAIFIYINTLIKLYGWVDKTLQFREEHWNDVDQWGGI